LKKETGLRLTNNILWQVIFMENKDWFILGFLLIAAFFFWAGRRRSGRIAGQKSAKSNPRARAILEEAGYEILKIKPTLTVRMEVDDQPYPFVLKSDFIVSRGGRRYIVQLQQENKQLRLQSKLGRNTLLRDVLAFRADGILVINLRKETLSQVRFRI
jgi:membrane protein implicated in regulation of membrane protease activity